MSDLKKLKRRRGYNKDIEAQSDIHTSYSLIPQNIESIIVSYQNSKLAQELSAQAIFGAFALKGKLPVSIKEDFKVDTGIDTYSLSRLEYTIPEDVNMSSKKLSEIDRVVDTIDPELTTYQSLFTECNFEKF